MNAAAKLVFTILGVAFHSHCLSQAQNFLYILQPKRSCTGCLGLYGKSISMLDDKFQKIFVFQNDDFFKEENAKQYMKDTYGLQTPFAAILSDSLYAALLKKQTGLKNKVKQLPLLFYSNGRDDVKYLTSLDKLAENPGLINAQYQYSLYKATKPLPIDSEIFRSCPYCYFEVSNDSFLVGSTFSSKINIVSIQNSKTRIRRDLLAKKNYLSIYKKINQGDTVGFTQFKSMLPFAPLLTFSALYHNGTYLIPTAYYRVDRDSTHIKIGSTESGIIKISANNDPPELIPVRFDFGEYRMRFYKFIYSRNDTLYFLLANLNAKLKYKDFIIGKFKRDDNDSIVFVDFVREFKSLQRRESQSHSHLPIFRNSWVFLIDNNEVVNVENKSRIKLPPKTIYSEINKRLSYSVKIENITWLDFAEVNSNYRCIFTDHEFIFVITISANNYQLLNIQALPLHESGKFSTTPVFKDDNIYYISTVGYFTILNIK